jgi:hypothetical protein
MKKRAKKPPLARASRTDPTALSKKLSEIYGEPIGPDATREIAANLTAFFELLAKWDDAERRQKGGPDGLEVQGK